MFFFYTPIWALSYCFFFALKTCFYFCVHQYTENAFPMPISWFSSDIVFLPPDPISISILEHNSQTISLNEICSSHYCGCPPHFFCLYLFLFTSSIIDFFQFYLFVCSIEFVSLFIQFYLFIYCILHYYASFHYSGLLSFIFFFHISVLFFFFFTSKDNLIFLSSLFSFLHQLSKCYL